MSRLTPELRKVHCRHWKLFPKAGDSGSPASLLVHCPKDALGRVHISQTGQDQGAHGSGTGIPSVRPAPVLCGAVVPVLSQLLAFTAVGTIEIAAARGCEGPQPICLWLAVVQPGQYDRGSAPSTNENELYGYCPAPIRAWIRKSLSLATWCRAHRNRHQAAAAAALVVNACRQRLHILCWASVLVEFQGCSNRFKRRQSLLMGRTALIDEPRPCRPHFVSRHFMCLLVKCCGRWRGWSCCVLQASA
jgi:hypothetical protein